MTSASEHIDKIFLQLEDLLSINQRNDLAGGKSTTYYRQQFTKKSRDKAIKAVLHDTTSQYVIE